MLISISMFVVQSGKVKYIPYSIHINVEYTNIIWNVNYHYVPGQDSFSVQICNIRTKNQTYQTILRK